MSSMAPESRDEVPHRDEVRQRINSLYDQAEKATGNYNATRAMASVTRSRGVPLAKRPGRRPDPALDEVARPWFDMARAQLGPTVPAVLPADRLPGRPAPGRSRERRGGGVPDGTPDAPGTGLPDRRPEALERAAGRAVAELTAGPAPDPEQLALAARAGGRAALPAPRRPELPGLAGELTLPAAAAPMGAEAQAVTAGLDAPRPAPGTPGLGLPPQPAGPGPVETAALPVAGPSAPQGIPAQEPWALPGPTAPGRPSPAASKAGNQRKLAAASDVISRYAAQLVGALAVPPASVTPMPSASVTATSPVSATAAPPASVSVTPATPVTAVPPTPMTPTPAAPVSASPLAPLEAEPPASLAPAPPTPVTAAPPTPLTATPVPPPPPTALTATPVVTAPPAQPFSDPGTGQWQQPQWVSPGGTVTATPAEDAWSTWSTTGVSATDTGSFAPLSESSSAVRAAKAVAFARAQIGKPCVWGATGPDSYDCSSLTQAAWRAAGVTLPRAAHQQALAGAPVGLADVEPGDLVLFFDDDRHVGLHVGGGMMVHAPGPGSSIREESIYGAGESAIHRIVRLA
ncbi:NlpC/P60 family protein [Streptomyces sp. NPDC001851]|uniref:C40 family peptidase n=1 Tax=Streptomyces sp. NPDC001851 TaxID=3154529 RepID=UPI003331F8C7